jgi:hypothetical protein
VSEASHNVSAISRVASRLVPSPLFVYVYHTESDPFSNKLRERCSIVSLHFCMCDCHEAYKKGIRHLRVLLSRLLVVTHLWLFPAPIPDPTPWHPRRSNKTELCMRRTKTNLKRIHHWSLMSIQVLETRRKCQNGFGGSNVLRRTMDATFCV